MELKGDSNEFRALVFFFALVALGVLGKAPPPCASVAPTEGSRALP